MKIDQRNSGGSVTSLAGTQYLVDRWRSNLSQSSKLSFQQNGGSVTPPVGFTNYIGITSLSTYSITSGDYFQFEQSIEGLNTYDLAWGTASAKTITISFYVYSSLTGNFGLFLTNSAVNRVYPTSYTVNSANTWEYKTITVAGDTTGTWLTTNGIGIRISFNIAYGSTYIGTGNAWNAGTVFQPSGCQNLVATNGATLYITGVQLELGSNASGFELLPIDVELARCLRYYEVGGFFNVSYGSGGTNIGSTIKYAVVKRAAPTFTQTSTSNVNCSATPSAGSTGNNTESILSYRTGASGGTQYSETWTASAEL
jgi:hypothetical protein